MKVLECYPFADSSIRLVEGFSVYDGVLGDEPGTPHKGVDYILRVSQEYRPFDVYAAHPGIAFRGQSETWGGFVAIYGKAINDKQPITIYAHLDCIESSIPEFSKEGKNKAGLVVLPGKYLGLTGTTGRTNSIPQLHFEMHLKDLKTGTREKVDPYGIYDRASSGKYSQPGEKLNGKHYWHVDQPSLAPVRSPKQALFLTTPGHRSR
jgi:murein DD-endopeptidase MepM/ murein hydrolase activator NlpD